MSDTPRTDAAWAAWDNGSGPDLILKTSQDLERENAELREQRDSAVQLLAQWCLAIEEKGTSWDDWDEYYKDASYRPGPLRNLIDEAKLKE